MDAPPSKCADTKSDTFCKADFMYYYVYPISDTFTLLASIIGLISNEFTGTASKSALNITSGALPVEENSRNCSKVKDIGGYYLHLFLTAISIIMNISQILYLLPPGSSSSEIFTDIDRILNSKGRVSAQYFSRILIFEREYPILDGKMVYLLMGNIAWGFIAVYQAVSNCRREHQNQIKRQYKIYSAVKSVSFIKRLEKH